MNQGCCDTPANPAQSSSAVLERMAKLGQEGMAIGMRGAKAWVDAYSQLFSSIMPAASGTSCAIPQTACPPYCACTLEWTVVPGDQRVGHIRITNTSQQPIAYSLEATPLHTCGQTLETRPRLEPQFARAAPGESLLVQVAIDTDKSWQPGEIYESEIKVRGLYEQCVCVRVHVPAAPEPCCALEMGEIPKRVSADDWWRHFQCTELCFAPIPQRGANEPPR